MPRTTGASSLPLEQQIRDTERGLAERRRSAGVHLATAKRRVRANLNSPLTLLVAFGVGIGLGQVLGPRRSRRRQAQPAPVQDAPAAAGAGVAGAGVLPVILDLLRLAAPIMAMRSALHRTDTPPTPPHARDDAGGSP